MKKCIEDYLNSHTSSYNGKYRYHSNIRTKKFEYKFLYYILDEQLHKMNVYVVIDFSGDTLNTSFSINLHEQEKEYITKDALSRINFFGQFNAIIHPSMIDAYMTNNDFSSNLTPLDYRVILEYLEYHRGTNQETIDEFYRIYLPYLQRMIRNKNYKNFLDSVILIVNKITYEYQWDGETLKYYDTQYQYHIYYLCKVLKILEDYLEEVYQEDSSKLFYLFTKLVKYSNFCLLIIDNVTKLIFDNREIGQAFFKYAFEFNPDLKESVLLKGMLARFNSDNEVYHDSLLDLLKELINQRLTYLNCDIQSEISTYLVRKHGVNLLLDLFRRDFNTFIFVAFPIKNFSKDIQILIKDELEKAIKFYAARMNVAKYRMSSFEQVMNIYRLLLNNYEGV